MLYKINSCELFGLEGRVIEVEVNVAQGSPQFFIIGLPDAGINEAKIRVRTALKNMGIGFPYTMRVVINLAPADLRKEGPSYDMAFAVGIALCRLGISVDLSDSMMVGELALDGKFRHIRGVLSIVDLAKRSGYKKVFLPEVDAKEASLISGIEIIPVDNLYQLISHLTGQRKIKSFVSTTRLMAHCVEHDFDMQYIRGQAHAKRAMEIAASGMHNILMSGPPGSGKTLLAKTLPSILPKMSEEEILEVTKIYSVAGIIQPNSPVVRKRTFRSPHHSASATSLIGGGRIPRPGEVSLAHRGVLFLDEFAEFPRYTLETLRQPLEDNQVTISRVEASLSYPASFMLVASQNPCPCGYHGDQVKQCVCTPRQVVQYQQKISGPLLDRIDINIEVPRLTFDELNQEANEETSAIIRQRVERVREIQQKRFFGTRLKFNSEMQTREINKFCALDSQSQQIIRRAVEQLSLSPRSYYRILKLARTIADLAESEKILPQHLAEAVQYRLK